MIFFVSSAIVVMPYVDICECDCSRWIRFNSSLKFDSISPHAPRWEAENDFPAENNRGQNGTLVLVQSTAHTIFPGFIFSRTIWYVFIHSLAPGVCVIVGRASLADLSCTASTTLMALSTRGGGGSNRDAYDPLECSLLRMFIIWPTLYFAAPVFPPHNHVAEKKKLLHSLPIFCVRCIAPLDQPL